MASGGALSNPRVHQFIATRFFGKLCNKLVSSEHGKDLPVHLQAVGGHRFAAGDILMMGKCIDDGRKLGSVSAEAGFFFPFLAGAGPPPNETRVQKG
jgi:hypothetical protein